MTSFGLRGRESTIFAGALVVGTFLVSFGVLHYGVFTKDVLLDTPLYERYGDAIVHRGLVPYRDFAVEYPPGALAAFIAPALIAGHRHFTLYQKLFEGLMLACGAIGAALVAFVLTRQHASSARIVAGTLLAGLAPLALGPVVLSRFDLWPAVLTIGALSALVTDRSRLGFGLLGAAVVAKVYPIVLVPLAAIYVWRTKDRREALACLGVSVGVIAVFVVPFLVIAPHGVWSSVSGQLGRPLQIESLGASILLAAHQLSGIGLNEVTSHGSDNLGGSTAAAFSTVQSALSLATILALWIAFARGAADRDRLLRYAAALVCAFITLNKVLSPQYLMWLIALVPLVRGRRGIAAGVLFVFAMVLTQLWFPTHYISLVYSLDARASWYVLARDITLVALLLTLVWPDGRGRRFGIPLVAVLVIGAASVAAVAAETSRATQGPVHRGLLVQSGLPSRCGVPHVVPRVSPGTVAYEVARFPTPDGGSPCVTIELTAPPHVELFSAAYRRTFSPRAIRAGYVGDTGKCTNIPGFSSAQTAYSVTAPRRSYLAVEVENCGSGSSVPPYSVDVRGGGTTVPAVFKAATADQSGNVVKFSWSTSTTVPGTTFAVYLQEGPASVVPIEAPVRARGTGRYAAMARHAPLSRASRYWILARSPDGAWEWHGPISTT